MEGAYYNPYGALSPKRKRRSLLLRVADLLLTLLTVVVAAAMLLTFLVPYVDPARVWFFPVLGLAAPAVYTATVLLALYWIIRWRWVRAGLMLTLAVAGFIWMPLFWRPDVRRDYGGETSERGTFKIMTYNVRNFYGDGGQSSVGCVLRLIGEEDPDVVCLQEFNARLAGKHEEFGLLDEKYESVVFGRTEAPDSLYGAPLVILSKYRILRSGIVLTPATSVWADLLIDEDTVRVFNNHLRSTAIKAADNDYITRRGFIADTAREDKIRSIVERYRANSVLRAAQVDSIAQMVGRIGVRRIVCGDFNDTPMSYVYRTMARGLNDAFSEAGTGYSHTFRGFFNMLRIDYVLSSEGFETAAYSVPQIDCSDHRPVVVRLRKIQATH